jgi:hypothetical protein
MWHAWERRTNCRPTRYLWENSKERDISEDRRRRRECGIKMDLREGDWLGRGWIGFGWLRTGTVVGLL